MTYAVIATGGKQYRVSEGSVLRVEKLEKAVGEKIEFGDVLLLGGEQVVVGKPHVQGAKVTAEVLSQGRHKKIIVFKMKRRKNYRRKYGHRQPFTELKITAIQGA